VLNVKKCICWYSSIIEFFWYFTFVVPCIINLFYWITNLMQL